MKVEIRKVRNIVAKDISVPIKAELDEEGLWIVSFSNLVNAYVVETLVDWETLKKIHDRLSNSEDDGK